MSLPVIIEAEAIANLAHAAKWWAKNRDADQALRWQTAWQGGAARLRQIPSGAEATYRPRPFRVAMSRLVPKDVKTKTSGP